MIEQTQRSKPNISLTPLIDVVFILLIFFMLIMQFKKYQQLPISVIEQSLEVQDVLSTNRKETLKLLLQEDGKCSVDASSSECSALIEQLNARSTPTVVFSFEEKTTLGQILQVYQLLLDKEMKIQLSTFASSVKSDAIATSSSMVNNIAKEPDENSNITLSKTTLGREDVRE